MPLKPFKAPSLNADVLNYVAQKKVWDALEDMHKVVAELYKMAYAAPAQRAKRFPNSVQPQGCNKTGVRLPVGDSDFSPVIIGYDEPMWDPTDPDLEFDFCIDNAFEYVYPTDDHKCCFGVLNCPADVDEETEVTMSGLTHVRINLRSMEHERVQAVPGSSNTLKSVPISNCAGGRIVWKSSGSVGVQWAVVSLTPHSNGSPFKSITPVDLPGGVEVETSFDGVGLVLVKSDELILAGAKVLVVPCADGCDCCEVVELC